jgi:16S rRNA (adenine1518-N6/adenine1519-N6)-dimethyltransferase
MESRRTVRQAGSTSTYSRRKQPAARAPGVPPPKKSLGQHWLRDRNIIERIVAAADVTASDRVLEVGPGLGDLTQALAERAAGVVAVEVDGRLAAELRKRFASDPRVTVLEQDALHLDPASVFGPTGEYVVVSNLPYNVGTAIVRHLLEAQPRPRRLVVMLQKEVAAAMLAPAGRLSLLGVAVQVFATGRRLFDVAPGAFTPPPAVRSSVVRLDVRPEPLVPEPERDRFFDVVRAGFSAPRKQVRNALAQGLGLPAAEAEALLRQAGIDPARRPETLSIEEWLRLARTRR